MDVSANSLLGMVAAGRLDMAFVHEVEGIPLRVPPGLRLRVLVEREPQFVTLAADHPAAARGRVRLTDPAGDRWMVDSTVDGDGDAVWRVPRTAGLEPDMLYGDYLTAYSLTATGDIVTVSQPTALPRPDLAIRPLEGDPMGVRLLLAARTECELDCAWDELAEAYWEVALQAPAYREWLERAGAPRPPRSSGSQPASPGGGSSLGPAPRVRDPGRRVARHRGDQVPAVPAVREIAAASTSAPPRSATL